MFSISVDGGIEIRCCKTRYPLGEFSERYRWHIYESEFGGEVPISRGTARAILAEATTGGFFSDGIIVMHGSLFGSEGKLEPWGVIGNA